MLPKGHFVENGVEKNITTEFITWPCKNILRNGLQLRLIGAFTTSAGKQVCLIFFCSNGLCLNGFRDLDSHSLREDLNVFPAVSAYIMWKGNSWGHTFLIELNLPNHNPSMFFWIPADESPCRAQSGQFTFLLLLIVSVPKEVESPSCNVWVFVVFCIFWLSPKKGGLPDFILTFLPQQHRIVVRFALLFLWMFLMAQLSCYQFRFQQHGPYCTWWRDKPFL